MANYKIKFLDKVNDCTIETRALLYPEYEDNSIIIKIYDNSKGTNEYLFLDKSTAIKFAKTLRTEINKIQEVDNGNR